MIRMEEKIKNIHVVLKKNRIEKFNTIKMKLEINSDVDVMRACLDIAHKQLIEDKLSIKSELLSIAENISGSTFLQKKYLVFSVSDIINDALQKWIQNHYSEYSLFSFSLRKELSEKENRVALVFIENQSDYDRGMSLDAISNLLPDLGSADILRIIKFFLDKDLLQSTVIKGETYYFAPLT